MPPPVPPGPPGVPGRAGRRPGPPGSVGGGGAAGPSGSPLPPPLGSTPAPPTAASPAGTRNSAAARQDRLGPGLAVDVDHRAAGGPAVGHDEVAVRLDVDRARVVERRARREHASSRPSPGPRARPGRSPATYERPVELDGDVARVVERRARRDGRHRARPGIDAAQRAPVGDEQLAGLVHGEADRVLEVGDVRSGRRWRGRAAAPRRAAGRTRRPCRPEPARCPRGPAARRR